ncbi:DUF58 domain-containing protein [Pontibacillus marinus]|uniref:DUF58 domain-containing protein n=1 Tax=Pontibacillus marinus BH030004 = DSM 16465 TaxID=1385511 RepID=A0A0A5GC73_9BACI|nr:DUF58 domain-containing protein [Pontibacillus marinus]KGX90786.1 hypothetical protein N783_18390 [Pontibacillus marinus BH030004 = DSM 16465]
MSTLLSPVLTKRLANFSLTTRQTVRGGHKGERRSQRLGSSLEFSDYRLYSPGDDLRQIDWNTYARTEKYYIKRFLDEQELPVSVYIDSTKSMGIHEEKWLRAKQMAAVFTFLSLANSDRLSVTPVASSTRAYPYTKGKAMTKKVMDYIEDVSLAPENEAFGDHLLKNVDRSRQGSFSIVISDFLEDPSKLFSSIKKMQAKRQQVLLIQVLLPEEKDPNYAGDLKLIDVESSGERDISMNPRVIKQYRERFEEHTNQIKSFCNKRGIDLVPCLTSDSLEETIFSSLMKKGWIGR